MSKGGDHGIMNWGYIEAQYSLTKGFVCLLLIKVNLGSTNSEVAKTAVSPAATWGS